MTSNEKTPQVQTSSRADKKDGTPFKSENKQSQVWKLCSQNCFQEEGTLNDAERVHLFYNPNAFHKIGRRLLTLIAHHYLIDRKTKSIFPEFFPYESITFN